MTEWKVNRFWTSSEVRATEGGWTVTLDGRPVRTPAKSLLVVPSEAMAREIAAEWDAQVEVVDPGSMPWTRSANAALDKVTVQFDEVAGLIADYGGTDLLCYRAERPQGLIERQNEGWNPVLDWAETALGARLRTASGVMFMAQDEAALARLDAQVRAFSPFQLTAFHDLVGLSGSLILGFATAQGFRSPEDAWTLSRIDEDWQISEWGEDEEAAEQAAAKRAAFLHAARFLTLS